MLNNLIEGVALGHMESADRPAPIAHKTLTDKTNSLKQKGLINYLFIYGCDLQLYLFSDSNPGMATFSSNALYGC